MFHSGTNAATMAAMAAITIDIGFASISAHRPDSAGITVPVISGTTVPPTKPTRLPTPVVMVPTAVITLPIITRAGPIAATIRPMVTMACFWPSSSVSKRAFASISSWVKCWNIGASISLIVSPSVDIAILAAFAAVVAPSTPSMVLL